MNQKESKKRKKIEPREIKEGTKNDGELKPQ